MTIFANRFQKIEEGYLYFPTEKSRGKFVTEEEYERVLADWINVAGNSGIWRSVFFIAMLCIGWGFAENQFDLPHWWGSAFTICAVFILIVRFFWWSLAPRRVTRSRPFIAAPRISISDR